MPKPTHYWFIARHPERPLVTQTFAVKAVCEWAAKDRAKYKAPAGWKIEPKSQPY